MPRAFHLSFEIIEMYLSALFYLSGTYKIVGIRGLYFNVGTYLRYVSKNLSINIYNLYDDQETQQMLKHDGSLQLLYFKNKQDNSWEHSKKFR